MRRLVFDQRSPVHPVSESRGGWSERYGGRRRRRTEILVSNIGFPSNTISVNTVPCFLFTKNSLSISVCVNTEVFVLFTANRPLISYWAATICVVSNTGGAVCREVFRVVCREVFRVVCSIVFRAVFSIVFTGQCSKYFAVHCTLIYLSTAVLSQICLPANRHKPQAEIQHFMSNSWLKQGLNS